MKKVINVLLVIGAIVLVVWFAAGYFGWGEVRPPTLKDAPYTLITESKTYLIESYRSLPDAVVITNYWTPKGEDWRYTEGSLTFVRKGYLKLEIRERR
jgi:hypothetical protein